MENNINYFYLSGETNETLSINFSKILEKEGLDVYNDFDLTSKKNFRNISSLILDTYNALFLQNNNLKENSEVVILNLLSAQNKIMNNKITQLNDFIDLLDKICTSGDSELLKIVENYVEENYSLEFDKHVETMKNKKSYNEQLVVSDEYGKKYLQVGYLSRVLIPVISQYFIYNKENFPTKKQSINNVEEDEEEELVFADINSKIFEKIFDLVANDAILNERLRNKIYKLCDSRVNPYSFSGIKFWDNAYKLGITTRKTLRDIYRKILTNSITKIICDPNLNIVNYFQASIKNHVEFLMKEKFSHDYQVVENVTKDDDNEKNNEYELLESSIMRKDEGAYVLQTINIPRVIKKLPEIFEVPITDEEIRNTERYVKINPIQEKIITMMVSKYFNDAKAIKKVDKYDYSKILLCCKKYLEVHKLSLLSTVLTAKCTVHKEKAGITGLVIGQKIKNTKKYRSLFETKYPSFQKEIEKPIVSLIGTIYKSIFEDFDGNILFDSSVKVGNFAEELVELVWLI